MSEELKLEQAPPQEPSQDTAEQDLIKAELVATAVNSQMSPSEAVQLQESKHMAQEFEKHAADQSLPVKPLAIRNEGSIMSDEARERANERYGKVESVRGLSKEHVNNINRDEIEKDGKTLIDPYAAVGNHDIYDLENAVVASEAKLADMPIGPWNQVQSRESSRDDRKMLVFNNNHDGYGTPEYSPDYAKFARQRGETERALVELRDKLAKAEEEKANPSLDERDRHFIDQDIANYKADIATIQGSEYSHRGSMPLGRIEQDEQSERDTLERRRNKLSEMYTGGAEYYRGMSERLNNNLNDVAQQFEDFYDIAPETFAAKSSKEFLESAREYFGHKEDIRVAELAAEHAAKLVSVYENYTEAIQSESGTKTPPGMIGIENLNRQVGRAFGFDLTERDGTWSYLNKVISEHEGEGLQQAVEEASTHVYYDRGNSLANTGNLVMYAEVVKKINAEWLDVSPRQTLERFSEFAKTLEEKQKETLQQKQTELDTFTESLKTNQ